ncbi:ribonuclease HII [uncultured Psychrobacter sp.]|uniref:ribonuclease HII n=1 Tax=uncultured Psychrobacter sp. TaxID=259303 RepID=UPI00345B14F3
MNNSFFVDSTFENQTIEIKTDIEHIDIKGQYINLAVPIRLFGQLNLVKLAAEYETLERSTISQDSKALKLQIGVDEAGRGPLLGSVNVAAAILPSLWSDLIERQPLQETPLSILTDSKQLSEKKREILYPLIQQQAIGYIIADIPPAVIDQINILQATILGMRLCTEALLEVVADQTAKAARLASGSLQAQILYDGNRCPELNYPKLAKIGLDKTSLDCQAWIKGDARHTSIAAASILAKVSRDQTMYVLDSKYPQYGIARHKGYPTRLHREAIDTHGVLPEHRRSFAPIRLALENNSDLKIRQNPSAPPKKNV